MQLLSRFFFSFIQSWFVYLFFFLKQVSERPGVIIGYVCLSSCWFARQCTGKIFGHFSEIFNFRVLPLLPQNKMQLLSRFFSSSQSWFVHLVFGLRTASQRDSNLWTFNIQVFNTSDYRKNLKRSWPTYSLSAHLLAFRGWMFLSRFTFVVRSR